MRGLLDKIELSRLNTDEWPTVNEDELSDDDLAVYKLRRACVLKLIETRSTAAAAAAGQCCRQQVGKLIRRCTMLDKDGRVVGFRGCKPRYRTKKNERGDFSKSSSGLFGAFLLKYPDICRKLTDFALRRGNRLEHPSEVGPVALRNKLNELCKDAGIGVLEYPRNTDEKAIRTLPEWYKKLADSNGREFNASRYGKESAANFDDGTESAPSHIDEHKTLVFDEYTIDTFVSIGLKQPDGTTEWTPMARFKTISGKRRGSGDIVICRKVLKSEPDTADFLEAVELAIRPHQRREFTVDGYQYPKEPCFVSELPGCDWLAP